jgi:hypothetical protein
MNPAQSCGARPADAPGSRLANLVILNDGAGGAWVMRAVLSQVVIVQASKP